MEASRSISSTLSSFSRVPAAKNDGVAGLHGLREVRDVGLGKIEDYRFGAQGRYLSALGDIAEHGNDSIPAMLQLLDKQPAGAARAAKNDYACHVYLLGCDRPTNFVDLLVKDE
jgi:hypothetical protein